MTDPNPTAPAKPEPAAVGGLPRHHANPDKAYPWLCAQCGHTASLKRGDLTEPLMCPGPDCSATLERAVRAKPEPAQP